MAFKKQKEATDYSALLAELKRDGPDRLYMLWGEEDYLRESFFQEIRSLCLPESSDFNYHRIDGESLELRDLAGAVDSVPFMGERTLIEVRGFKINDCKEETAQGLREIISDIPGYATVVFLLPSSYEPDGRLSLIKIIRKTGRAIEFTPQPQSLLISWIKRRFSSMGKSISSADCERLIFISGNRMTGLVPEIEKIANYVKGEAVSAADIEALAEHIPEAKVFEMTDCLAKRRYDAAAELMAELLKSGEHPIKTLAMIGFQMRRLYTARVAIDGGLTRSFVMETHNISGSYMADKLMDSARGFSTAEIVRAVELCAESDCLMKSSSEDDGDILRALLSRLALGHTV
jgi:DNA polymerase-3 subunit delta